MPGDEIQKPAEGARESLYDVPALDLQCYRGDIEFMVARDRAREPVDEYRPIVYIDATASHDFDGTPGMYANASLNADGVRAMIAWLQRALAAAERTG